MLPYILCLVVAVGPLTAHGITVDTKYGPVEGLTLPLHTGRSVNSFYAIPYAKPPVGELRWRVSVLGELR